MAGVRNQAWLTANSSRAYPLDESATLISDAGVRLPHYFLADLNLRFPRSLATYAFIGGITVSPRIVTLTILGAPTTVAASNFVTLAYISLPRPVTAGINYPITGLQAGVGGWLVFGSGIDSAEVFSARFSSPSKSLLMPGCARWYEDLPVESIGKSTSAFGLTGLVRLRGGNDIEIVKECREIPNRAPLAGTECDENQTLLRDVVVFRLKDKGLTTPRNVFDLYKGQCGARPESGNCGDPAPLEFISSVGPDCCGNLTIEFRGCAELTEISAEVEVDELGDPVESTEACGVIVDCALELAEACVTPNRLPSSDGTLPNEYDDLCVSVVSVSVPDTPVDPPEEPPIVVPPGDISINPDTASLSANDLLPYLDDFSTQNGQYTVKNGEFAYSEPVPGTFSYGTTGGSGQAFRNALVWNEDAGIFYRQAHVLVEMLAGPTAARHNAQLIVNYKEASPTRDAYWVAEIDWDGLYEGYKLFRIGHFDGRTFRTELDVAVPELALNTVYRISMTILPDIDDPTVAWLTAQLTTEESNDVDVTIGALRLPDFTPATGLFGFGTNRAVTRFYEFGVDNVTS